MSSDSNSNNDELVSQFIAFTGSSDSERASMYLEMSGNNLETAVGLYMEHQGGGGGGGARVDASSSNQDPFAGASASGEGGMGIGGGDVRAPDATRTMRLMDDPVGPPRGIGMMRHPYMPMIDPMIQHQIATSAFARDVVNNAAVDDDNMNDSEDDDSNYNDDNDEDDNGNSAGSRNNRNRNNNNNRSTINRATGLADMFAPPRHLLCKESFEGARTIAKDSKRWLLVNLQRDNEFSCHALNRDVWRDELVENLIGEGFIFWQDMDASQEGSVYAERYKVSDYPHVGIIDPRTRRLMWKKEGWTQQNPLTAEQFSEYAMDFCSRHSFDRPPQAPRLSSTANSTAGLPTKRPMQEMSEDEQLHAAMRASLKESSSSGGDIKNDSGDEYDYEMNDDDDDDVVIVDSNGEKVAQPDSKPQAFQKKEGTAKSADTSSTTTPTLSKLVPPSILQQLISFDIGDQPEEGARVQFRMPDGKRKIRKFDPSQNVRLAYAFVAQSNPEGSNGKEFILMVGFPPKDLMSVIDNSIESCSLAGETITVRWK